MEASNDSDITRGRSLTRRESRKRRMSPLDCNTAPDTVDDRVHQGVDDPHFRAPANVGHLLAACEFPMASMMAALSLSMSRPVDSPSAMILPSGPITL